MHPKLAVVVTPTYNEKENIRPLVNRLISVKDSLQGLELNILFVDDKSPDGTAEVIKGLMKESPFVFLLERSSRRGIGTAYIDGFRYAMERFHPSFYIQIDADLQHPPEKITEFVNMLEKGSDVVLGSRYVKGGGIEGWSWRRRMISKGANWLARFLLGLELKDVTTGFKVINAKAVEALKDAKLSSSGFSYQVESLILFKKKGLKIVELPFVFEERVKGQSKLSIGEIWQFIKSIMMMRFKTVDTT
jgi:dolichol-phosphate mannosyltransferase